MGKSTMLHSIVNIFDRHMRFNYIYLNEDFHSNETYLSYIENFGKAIHHKFIQIINYLNKKGKNLSISDLSLFIHNIIERIYYSANNYLKKVEGRIPLTKFQFELLFLKNLNTQNKSYLYTNNDNYDLDRFDKAMYSLLKKYKIEELEDYEIEYNLFEEGLLETIIQEFNESQIID